VNLLIGSTDLLVLTPPLRQISVIETLKGHAMLKLVIPALLLSAGLSLPAQAQDVTRAVPVAYSDLNLRSAEGIDRLNRRLNKAIQNVCSEDMMVYPQARREIRRCMHSKHAEVAALRARVLSNAGVEQTAYLAGR
jgi:UrcA family protein